MEKFLKRFFIIVLINFSGVLLYITYVHGINLDVTLIMVSAVTIGLAYWLNKSPALFGSLNLVVMRL